MKRLGTLGLLVTAVSSVVIDSPSTYPIHWAEIGITDVSTPIDLVLAIKQQNVESMWTWICLLLRFGTNLSAEIHVAQIFTQVLNGIYLRLHLQIQTNMETG